jgi:membrane associated rhomboid family serine protease
MIIPIRSDYRRKQTPWVNYALILTNVLLFVLLYVIRSRSVSETYFHEIGAWMLDPTSPSLEQFFSCIFLHASWAHLLGNMVFLWVFGNAINDKLGHAGYLAFYLAGGILAGVGYLLLAGTSPVLGASGAIAAVTGAYLVLLPRTNITLLVLLFYFLLPLQVSSLYFIAIQFAFDSIMTLWGSVGPGSGGVAYAAHATGYVFGIAVAAMLLAVRVLPRDDFDLLHLFKNYHRRAAYRRMVAGGFDPFAGVRPVQSRVVEAGPLDNADASELELRRKIADACRTYDTPGAASLYLQLTRIADEPVLPLQMQLDVANQLMAAGQHAAAADAYERFVKQYGDYQYISDIHLMLGLLFGRYLHQADRAETYLAKAVDQLTDPGKKAMADKELANIRRGNKTNPPE